MEDHVRGEGRAAEPPSGTLAALLTAALSAKLAAAVSELVGAASEGKGDGRSTAAAQDLFRRMADWDHVLFRVP